MCVWLSIVHKALLWTEFCYVCDRTYAAPRGFIIIDEHSNNSCYFHVLYICSETPPDLFDFGDIRCCDTQITAVVDVDKTTPHKYLCSI